MEAAVLAAIASPRRREILRLVWTREMAAGEIAAAMPDVTFGAVSLQLRALEDAGLVVCRPDHRHRFYRAERNALGPVGKLLEGMWDDALWRLKVAARTRSLASRAVARTHASANTRNNAKDEGGMTGTSLLSSLTHRLDRDVVIEAPREIVFRFFTDAQRWAAWWGAGSTIDPMPGGKLVIRYPDGTEVLGEVLDIDDAGTLRLHVRLRVGRDDRPRRLARHDPAGRGPARHAAPPHA